MEVSAANEHLVFEARPPQAKGIIGDNPSLSARTSIVLRQEHFLSPDAPRACSREREEMENDLTQCGTIDVL